jgi:hypothetical protein
MKELFEEEFLQLIFQPSRDIQVEYNDDYGRVTCYFASVRSYESGSLEITIADNGQIPKLAVGNRLILSADHPKKSSAYYFQVTICEVISGPTLLLKLSRLEKMDVNSLRCFFRCNVTLPFHYIDAAVLEFPGEIINLSAGGLLGIIRYDSTLKVGNELEVQFTIPSVTKPFRLPAKIVRIINLTDGRQKIAVQFTQISEMQQNQIIKYLFVYHRIARKK